MHTVTLRYRPARTALAVALTVLLGACGRHDLGTHASQVAAKVNSDEITVSQLDFLLSRLGVANQEQAEQAQGKALNSLIDTHLLAQQALKQGLDRDPQVLHALQYARQQVLAQAYIAHVVNHKGLHKPSDSEVQGYYDKHPALFAKRRVYRLRNVNIQGDPGNERQIRNEIIQAKTFAELSQWLRGRDIPFTTQEQTRAAEDLPLGLLPKLNRLKDRQFLDTTEGGTPQALQLVSVEEQPLSLDEAAPLIERFLVNRSRMDLARAEIKRLRGLASIKFVGSFQEAIPDRPANVTAAASTSDSKQKQSDFMDKGLSGLK